MARLHFVKRARKDNPVAKAGESYYWWKFRYGPKHYSKTRPSRSQLTQSSFLTSIYDLEDGISDEMTPDDAGILVSELEGLRDECQDSLDNMPEHLQESSESGMLLQERIDCLEEWIDAIQDDIDWESLTPEEAADAIRDAEPGF